MRKNYAKLLASVTLVLVLLPVMGLAHDRQYARYHRGINTRQHEQQERIREGIRSGELTRRETRRLEAEQARIRVDEAFARRSGGRFTATERHRIQRELNHASRDIYRQKHDRQDR